MEEVRTILLYGDSGGGKTTNLAFFAKWLWENQGLKTLLVSCETGGTSPFDDLGLIEKGIVIRYDLLNSQNVIADAAKISKGYWPKGEVIRESQEYKIKESDAIGAVMFDSITGFAERLADWISTPDKNIAFKLGTVSQEDDYKFGSLARGHYIVIHGIIGTVFQFGFRRMPIKYFIVTARIDKAEERNVSGYYPETIGKANKTKILSWFMDCLHLAQEQVTGETLVSQKLYSREEIGEGNRTFQIFAAWFKDHPDELTSIPYKAKIRMIPEGMELVNERFKEGFCVLDSKKGIVRLYQYLELVRKVLIKRENERVIQEAADRLQKHKENESTLN